MKPHGIALKMEVVSASPASSAEQADSSHAGAEDRGSFIFEFAASSFASHTRSHDALSQGF